MKYFRPWEEDERRAYNKAKRRRSYLKNREIEIDRAREYARAHPLLVAQWKKESRARHSAKWSATQRAKRQAAKLALV